MLRLLRNLLLILLTLGVLLAAFASWRVWVSLPQRDGTIALSGLSAPVTVRYDERGVPHITASNEIDLYRALGYVHGQDRLFQMEMARRLARGELSEILGPSLLETDRFFRTLGLRHRGEELAARMDRSHPVTLSLMAYLDGLNQFQELGRLPIEFTLLGIEPRDFHPEDTMAVVGYLAFSFAAAFRTEPVLTQIRDHLGTNHLRIFKTEGLTPPRSSALLPTQTTEQLSRLAAWSADAAEQMRLPLMHGSNAWAVSGARTASGKPLLAGDPHITYALPSAWYEAHLQSPGFELYGHHQALGPFALLGHNRNFGWSLTMFQNDDVDFVAERLDPARPGQVWHQGQWVALRERKELIAVKGQGPFELTVRTSPHGPLITDLFKPVLPQQAVSLWWTFLDSNNPVLEAFYQLNRADTLAKAREAVKGIHAPGLNVVWASAGGDIAWWAAARLAQRPPGVDPGFVLDAARGEAVKGTYLPFERNPQEENPARGYIVSANQQPATAQPPPGYYNLPDRARRIDAALKDPKPRWTADQTRALQQDTSSTYATALLRNMLPALPAQAPSEAALLQALATWDGSYQVDSVNATVFTQWIYEVARAAMADELGPAFFEQLLKTRALDHALPRLLADAHSPWWDDTSTKDIETREQILLRAWRAALSHLTTLYGEQTSQWTWGRAHTVKHGHPLGRKKPLDLLFDVGPFAVPGGREIINNHSHPLGPAPWAVTYGPSTRRVIDWAEPGKAVGINPVGQSGVLFDRHYKDQADDFHQGLYRPQHLLEADVKAHTSSTLKLRPER
jgi:penicillin amidase